MLRILADVHTAGWTSDFPEISCQSSRFDLENKTSNLNARVPTKMPTVNISIKNLGSLQSFTF